MKAVLLLTLSFLFASLTNLTLAFSKNYNEPVFDTHGNILLSGDQYLIQGKEGVVTEGEMNIESICPVTVSESGISGIPVIFNVPYNNIILTGTPLHIDFAPNDTKCKKSGWSLFWDSVRNENYVGISDNGDNPVQQFRIQKYENHPDQPYNSYKLVVCPHGQSLCFDIGTAENGKDERRLVLPTNKPFQVEFQHVPTKKSVV